MFTSLEAEFRDQKTEGKSEKESRDAGLGKSGASRRSRHATVVRTVPYATFLAAGLV
jgi:hypothetical protein